MRKARPAGWKPRPVGVSRCQADKLLHPIAASHTPRGAPPTLGNVRNSDGPASLEIAGHWAFRRGNLEIRLR